MSKQDTVRRYVLEAYKEGDRFWSSEVIENTGTKPCVACNVLREMKEEGILSRRRNAQKWEYFLTDPHDPDEYIQDKRSGKILSRKFASLYGQISKLQTLIEDMKKASQSHVLHVGCDCGKRLSVEVNVRVIEDHD